MSVVAIDDAQPAGFWRRLSRALDGYFVVRAKCAVPEITLRRSKNEIARCRRLMHQKPLMRRP